MKNIKNSNKPSFFKKLFIKISRKLGYEIIDQNNFEVVTSNKKIDEHLSTLGHKSINLPLGEVKITRKVKTLDIIIRTCASVNMLTQNKSRLFEKKKIEYTIRTIRSLLNSSKNHDLKKLEINFKVIDHNSTSENLGAIASVFKEFGKKYSLINLDVSKFTNKIEKINQRGEKVTDNQISNMSNIRKSLEISKNRKLPRMHSVQNPYNLLNRSYEIGLAEMSIREQAGLLAYSPLACGYLSGKYRNNQLPKKSRIALHKDFWTRYNKPNSNKAIDAYYEIAKKYKLDLAQMSLKFLEIQPFVTSVIIGATTMEQLKTNIESVNINLTNEIIN